jgi:hypothetical protein
MVHERPSAVIRDRIVLLKDITSQSGCKKIPRGIGKPAGIRGYFQFSAAIFTKGWF